MAYQVWLIDDVTYVELDCEEIDMMSSFSVSDIKDISVKKDSVKSITFKGTKKNNEAFGNLYNLNRTTNEEIDNKLFFNYNAMRPVQCLVYEDGILVFKGSLRVNEISVSPSGDAVYSTVVTGGFIDFKNALQDKLLTDLDFIDFKHRSSATNIQNSWDSSTERYNPTTGLYSTQIFEMGSGYVYPNIDYGVGFLTRDQYGDANKVHSRNFRPAIFLREYFNRIFSQPSLSSFTYEIKGDAEFQAKFNSLIIPNADESFKQIYKGFTVTKSKPLVVGLIDQNTPGYPVGDTTWSKLMRVDSYTPPPSNTITSLLSLYNSYNDVIQVDRTFTANGLLSVQFQLIYNGNLDTITISAELVERTPPTTPDQSPTSGWSVVAAKKISVANSETLENITLSTEIGERQYLLQNQLAIRITITGLDEPYFTEYRVKDARISFPKDNESTLKAEVEVGLESGDIIDVKPPDAIKQIDFLKSIINLFNMYAYTKTENPKHIIFEKYNDYYAYTLPQYVVTNSLDWTNKIDYSNGFKIKENISLPKAYSFLYKADTDWINEEYKKTYNKVYGQFDFNDSYGLIEAKKVELLFSPTPMLTELSTDRMYGALYSGSTFAKKPIKTNIRILYYNGLKDCISWTISSEAYISNEWTMVDLLTLNKYPAATNYYFNDDDVPTDDLNFALPARAYYKLSAEQIAASSAYANYYRSQISDLTSIDTKYIECSVLLNELDIANLDLKIPVYIDFGSKGNTYFKVIEVEYRDNNTPSKVLLQKIVA